MKILHRFPFNFRRGFTLLEVMLAMAVLAIALVAVFQSQSQSISMAGISRFYTTAPLLAQSKMAETEAMPVADIGSEDGDFGEDFPQYAWQVTVADTGFEFLKRIEVTVTGAMMNSNNTYQLTMYRFTGQ